MKNRKMKIEMMSMMMNMMMMIQRKMIEIAAAEAALQTQHKLWILGPEIMHDDHLNVLNI